MGNVINSCPFCDYETRSYDGHVCGRCSDWCEAAKREFRVQRFAQLAKRQELAKHIDGLKSVATSARVALTEAMPYVHNGAVKQKMQNVLKRLNLWGTHS